jgi:nitroreductase
MTTLADTIRTRRTVKNFTGTAIPKNTLTTWLELACLAPTHRLTQPWRFAVLNQPAITRLGQFLIHEPQIAAVPDPAKGAAKLEKLLSRLPSVGAIVQVVWQRDANPAIDLEEHAAASAAVQNLLLAAHADGYAGYWSTTAALGHPLTLAWCGFDPAQHGFLGSVWLGKAAEVPPCPTRAPLAERVRWL